jgi:hypothetical protein
MLKEHNSSQVNLSNAQTFNNPNNPNNIHNMSYNNNLNESFNKESYLKKKKENKDLQDEIHRLKLSIADILRSQNENQYFRNLDICYEQIIEVLPLRNYNNNTYNSNNLINDFKNSMKYSSFKETKKFYTDYYNEIESISKKVEDLKYKNVSLDKFIKKIEDELEDKNIINNNKFSSLKELLNQSQKSTSSIVYYFKKFNNDMLFYSTNLKKVFDFISKVVYTDNVNTNTKYISSNNKFNDKDRNQVREVYGNNSVYESKHIN